MKRTFWQLFAVGTSSKFPAVLFRGSSFGLRGLSKERARVDLWLKEIAPSTELRKWFGHDPSKWTEFQARYRKELKSEAELLDFLKKKAAKGPITLLYGAKDEVHNEAVVLQSLLQPK